MSKGIEKAAALVSLLGPQADGVLDLLPEAVSIEIRKLMEAGVPTDQGVINGLVSEAVTKVQSIDITALESPVLELPTTDELSLDEGEEGLVQAPLDEPIATQVEMVTPVSEAPIEIDLITPELPPVDFVALANALQDQTLQVSAFFLHYLEPKLQQEILSECPSAYRKQIESVFIDSMPISKKVHDAMYATLIAGAARA